MDARGNYGAPGLVLVGMFKLTEPPLVWIKDNDITPDYSPVENDLTRGVFDPWEFQKKPAHEKLAHGFWGGDQNRWNYFTYGEALKNQHSESKFLVQREYDGGLNTDAFVEKGNGKYVLSAEQFYWFPNSAQKVDPTSGEYFDESGIRRYNNGVIWKPSEGSNWADFRDGALIPAAALAAAVVTGAAIAPYVSGAGAAVGTAGAATTGTLTTSGAVVGAGLPAYVPAVAVPLSASAAVVPVAESLTALGALKAGAATMYDETVDFFTETAEGFIKSEIIKKALPENEPGAMIDENIPAIKTGTPPAAVASEVDQKKIIFSVLALLAGAVSFI